VLRAGSVVWYGEQYYYHLDWSLDTWGWVWRWICIFLHGCFWVLCHINHVPKAANAGGWTPSLGCRHLVVYVPCKYWIEALLIIKGCILEGIVGVGVGFWPLNIRGNKELCSSSVVSQTYWQSDWLTASLPSSPWYFWGGRSKLLQITQRAMWPSL
jgi:hypothetical protein